MLHCGKRRVYASTMRCAARACWTRSAAARCWEISHPSGELAKAWPLALLGLPQAAPTDIQVVWSYVSCQSAGSVVYVPAMRCCTLLPNLLTLHAQSISGI